MSRDFGIGHSTLPIRGRIFETGHLQGSSETSYPAPSQSDKGRCRHLDLKAVPGTFIPFIRYLGHYSNASRGRRKNGKEEPLTPGNPRDQEDDGFTDAERLARKRAWARLIRRVFEVDPMVCASCGGRMQIVSVILEHKVITKILGHRFGSSLYPFVATNGTLKHQTR